MTQCVACKQPVEPVLAVQTPHGPAHAGPCAHYAENMPISESTDVLQETELLM